MIRNLRSVTILSTALLAVACGGQEAEQDASTRDLSRDLLAEPVTDGKSTPVAADPELAQEGPRVPVAQVGINRGAVEAPVKVVELSDYGCGYCRQFHQETFPTLHSDFIETGMVEWKFVPFVTGMWESSLPATEAAECVYAQSEEAFESVNRRLWEEQRAWKGSSDPAAVVRDWVTELDVDMQAYDACLADDQRLGRVASATTLAQQLGVRGTPTFIVLGYPPLQGALSLDVFREVLSAVHADAVERSRQSGEGADTGGNDTGGNDAGGADTGGNDTGGDDSGGIDAAGAGVDGGDDDGKQG